jgi:GMP synthase-like glutamine amidotransferase
VRVAVLQHQELVGLGYLGESLERRGVRLEVGRADRGEPLPSGSEYDTLVVLGGTMNVYQEDEHPWLRAEDRLIRQTVERDQPLLGVCLGSQMLAKAMGARVRVGGAPEAGVMPIELTEAGRADRLFAGLGDAPEFVSWHDDTFEIPAGGVRLASSAGCANQAFRVGERAYGVAMAAGWLEELLPDANVDRAALLRAVEEREAALRARADRLVENFLAT